MNQPSEKKRPTARVSRDPCELNPFPVRGVVKIFLKIVTIEQKIKLHRNAHFENFVPLEKAYKIEI